MTVIIGIDPGKKGAAVLLVDGAPVIRRGRPLSARWETTAKGAPAYPVRCKRAFESLMQAASRAGVRPGGPDLVVIERVAINYHGKNQQGMAGLIEECGLWVGLMTEKGYPVVRADAARWLPDLTLEAKPKGTGTTKPWAERTANWWWPGVDWTASDRSKTAHDGLVDAALLALWGGLERTWSVQRAGHSRAPWRDVKGATNTTCIRARRVLTETTEKASRGAVRLLRDGKEIERWAT